MDEVYQRFRTAITAAAKDAISRGQTKKKKNYKSCWGAESENLHHDFLKTRADDANIKLLSHYKIVLTKTDMIGVKSCQHNRLNTLQSIGMERIEQLNKQKAAIFISLHDID